MDHRILASSPGLEPIPADVLAEAAGASRRDHDRLAARVPALGIVQRRFPPNPVRSWPKHLRVAAWNVERLKYVAASAALLAQVGADLVLLSEVDVGMARSGNRHTAEDLATLREAGFVFGVEFAELGLGDERERRWHAGATNDAGYHGNAILSRFALADASLIRLDDGGLWFGQAGAVEQRRLGGRIAILARLAEAPSPLWAVVVHLENRSDPATRAGQTRRLLSALEERIGDAPCVIGGDFNTSALPRGDRLPAAALEQPEAAEPLFAAMAAAGFGWVDANTADITSRTRPDGAPLPPFTRIDWLFVRGLAVRDAATIPAVDHNGAAISDHDLIAVEIAPF